MYAQLRKKHKSNRTNDYDKGSNKTYNDRPGEQCVRNVCL